VTENAPERSGKRTLDSFLRKHIVAHSYGDPVLEWRRPGGSDLAITVRGRKHTLVCRPVARALANLKQSDKAY